MEPTLRGTLPRPRPPEIAMFGRSTFRSGLLLALLAGLLLNLSVVPRAGLLLGKPKTAGAVGEAKEAETTKAEAEAVGLRPGNASAALLAPLGSDASCWAEHCLAESLHPQQICHGLRHCRAPPVGRC